MAEDEIRKHAKAAYKIMGDKNANWKHKAKDLFIEMLIIVFAVSISIWFHNWSDSLHDRHDEREFLEGFKKDLQNDIANLQASRDFYAGTVHGFTYFAKVGRGDTLSRDSLNKYSGLFFSWTELEQHNSRYEALKSSGRLGIIENTALLNNIIELNESTMVHINALNTLYLNYIGKTDDFIETHAQLDGPGHITNAKALLHTPQLRFMLGLTTSYIANNLIPAHDEGIKKCKALIVQIDKQLD